MSTASWPNDQVCRPLIVVGELGEAATAPVADEVEVDVGLNDLAYAPRPGEVGDCAAQTKCCWHSVSLPLKTQYVD
jgi:hypothetical protein